MQCCALPALPGNPSGISYTLVYRGQLGQESNAVIGRSKQRTYWEPWTLNPDTHDAKDFKMNHDWWYPSTSGTSAYSIKTNMSPETEVCKQQTILDYHSEPGMYSDPSGYTYNSLEMDTNIPIPQKKLYIRLKTEVVGSSTTDTDPGHVINLCLEDIHGKRLFVILSSSWWYGEELGPMLNGYSIAMPGAGTGSPNVADEGAVAVSLEPYLSETITYIAIETEHDNTVTVDWQCDFIDFR